jgi:hypothetical protein
MPIENVMTMRACILTAVHLKTALEMAKDNPQLRSISPLLETALLEVEAIRHTQAVLLRCYNNLVQCHGE